MMGTIQRKLPAKRLFNGLQGGSAFARVADEPLAVQQPTQQQVPCCVPGCERTYLAPVGEFLAPDFKYVCVDHTPQDKRAEAKAPKKGEIDPEVEKAIKASLASPPNSIPDPTPAVHVKGDTNIGTRTVVVKPGNDVETSVEDAADAVIRPQWIKKTPDTLITSTAPTKRAFPGQKSEPFLALFNPSNPNAPYGYDEAGKAIVPPRTDTEIATELLEKSFLKHGDCPHKLDPAHCVLCGTKFFKPLQNVVDTPEAMFQRVMQMFGCIWGPPKIDQGPPFNYYPEILGVNRGLLLQILEAPVDIEPQTELRKVVKPVATIQKQIEYLTKSREEATLRVEELKKLIDESEESIRSWGKKVMQIQYQKIGRPLDDMPDDNTRNGWIRQEKAKILKYQEEKLELQARLRGHRLNELQERLTNWGKSEDDYEHIQCAIPGRIVYFKERFKFSGQVNDKSDAYTQLKERGNTVTECYVSLLSTQYEVLQGFSRRFKEWASIDAWRYFENAVLLTAMEWGWIKPTDKAVELYPEMKYKAPEPDDDSEEDDKEMRAIIAKTGGLEIGASIYNFGFMPNGRFRRGSGDRAFDNTVAYAPRPKGTPDGMGGADNWTGGMDSGDCGERGGDE